FPRCISQLVKLSQALGIKDTAPGPITPTGNADADFPLGHGCGTPGPAVRFPSREGRVMAFDQARKEMVAVQLAGRGVRDARVLEAMAEIPREAFVDPGTEELAYEDRPLPIGESQTISQPLIVAAMAEAARLGPEDRVLEVGAGSGYAASVF